MEHWQILKKKKEKKEGIHKNQREQNLNTYLEFYLFNFKIYLEGKCMMSVISIKFSSSACKIVKL